MNYTVDCECVNTNANINYHEYNLDEMDTLSFLAYRNLCDLEQTEITYKTFKKIDWAKKFMVEEGWDNVKYYPEMSNILYMALDLGVKKKETEKTASNSPQQQPYPHDIGNIHIMMREIKEWVDFSKYEDEDENENERGSYNAELDLNELDNQDKDWVPYIDDADAELEEFHELDHDEEELTETTPPISRAIPTCEETDPYKWGINSVWNMASSLAKKIIS
tara:strand:- start:581 stop:1243 length:663 start_codon:yes stop_codon:yes gene_type:complete